MSVWWWARAVWSHPLPPFFLLTLCFLLPFFSFFLSLFLLPPFLSSFRPFSFYLSCFLLYFPPFHSPYTRFIVHIGSCFVPWLDGAEALNMWDITVKAICVKGIPLVAVFQDGLPAWDSTCFCLLPLWPCYHLRMSEVHCGHYGGWRAQILLLPVSLPTFLCTPLKECENPFKAVIGCCIYCGSYC